VTALRGSVKLAKPRCSLCRLRLGVSAPIAALYELQEHALELHREIVSGFDNAQGLL
jgi:hypothetical protein